MEKITKEQFDALKVGDELKNENYTLSVEAKFANTIIAINNSHNAVYLSIKELQHYKYSINQPLQHNCGFPYGDCSDKELVVKVSNASIEICENSSVYTRLKSVSEKGFRDNDGELFKYAVLVTNNVELIK